MDSRTLFSAIMLSLILATSGCSQPADTKTTEALQAVSFSPGLQVTIYNSDLGVVKESRTLDLGLGLGEYLFEGVASKIDTTSVKLNSEDGSFYVLEQNYKYDLVSREKLLQRYLGERISGYAVMGDEKELVEGTLLASSGSQLILQKDDGSIQMADVKDLRLPTLPDGLIVRPTLQWLINSASAGTKNAQLSYMTRGMSWSSDYVAVIDRDDKMMDLNGWVTVTNNAGTTFENATLKLVAGDVNRVKAAQMLSWETDAMYARSEAIPDQFAQQQLFEYHMYDLKRPTTLNDNEQKQISLMSAQGVGVEKEYVYESSGGWRVTGDTNKVQVKLNFDNSEDNGMGMPLPKGKLRVFKADEQGSLQFIGEDFIDHTPRDETLRILMGNAFDIVGERKRMTIRDLGCQHEVSWEVKLRNHKDEDIVVTVIERSGWDWTITSSNHGHTRESNERIRFSVPVKAREESVLRYTIRYNYC